jgi:glycosyltransferase involved in cell wall biosynthesis
MVQVSVLLPVRNAAPYLDASLRSLWRQTFPDFEVIAVDDGSTDESGAILDRAAQSETRLRVLHTGARGLPAALNTALGAARGRWMARHDADDLSHRSRFLLQCETLRRHRRVAVVGSRVRLFPRAAVGMGMRRWAAWHNSLMTHDHMVREILIDSTLVHGTAMFRREVLEEVGGWRDRIWAEDVDLWLRLIEVGARFAKRGEVLYAWRQHSASATRRDPRYRRENLLALKRAALERVFPHDTRCVSLVGVGASIEKWREILGNTRKVTVVEAARPGQSVVNRLDPPIILVFGAPIARARWREYLAGRGMIEGKTFIFVA